MASNDMFFYGESMIKPARSLTHLSTNRMVDNYFMSSTKQVAKFSIKEDKDRMVVVPEIKDINSILKKVIALEKIISLVLSDLGCLCTNFAPMITRRRRDKKKTTKKSGLGLSSSYLGMQESFIDYQV